MKKNSLNSWIPSIRRCLPVSLRKRSSAEKPKKKSKKRPQAEGFSGGKARDGRSSGAPKQGKQSDLTKLKKSVASTTGSTVGREIGKVVGEAMLGKKGRTLGGNIGSTIGRNLLGTLAKR